MIGWKAQYGYATATNADKLSKLSQIVFTDIDGYFTIPTVELNLPSGFKYASGSQSITTNSTPKISFSSAGELGTGLNSLLGEDYFRVYFKPDDGSTSLQSSDNNFSFIRTIWASGILSCPKLYTYMRNKTGGQQSYCYIPSLKRVIGGYGEVFRLEDDNITLTRLCQFVNMIGMNFCSFEPNGSDYGWMNIIISPGASSDKDSIISNGMVLQSMVSASINHYYCINKNVTSLTTFFNNLFSNYVQPDISSDILPPKPDDPDGNIDTDTDLPGGYDPDSDEIPWDVPDWLSASDLGMCTVYNPSVAQVKALATRLYSKDFQSGFENYIWGNPIESIIGLSVFPCPIPNGGTATVKSWGLDTGVTMTLAGSTLIHVNCGSIPVPNPYEGYLDYSPYTQAEVYIPYVGFVGLDSDDIMSQNLQLHYYIDIISGSATAKLVISNTSTTTVLGQWSCQVGRQIPIGSKDYNDIINAGVQLVAAAVGAYSGSVIPEVVTDLGDALQYEGGGFNGTKFGTQMLRAGSSAIMQAKPNITRGSAIASASGQLAVQYPYLILKRPVSAKTNGYGALVGYPTFKYGNIGSYSGFVRCQNIKLDGVGCTDWELSEIFRLCLEGVYI